MSNITDYVCPHCGNKSSEKGITLAWLEWHLCPVMGQHENKVVVDYDEYEWSDVNEKFTCENTPNAKPDLEHYHCNKCGWNWIDNQRDHKDTRDVEEDESKKQKFDDDLRRVQFGHYKDVRFRRYYEGTANTKQYNGEDGEALEDPIDHPVPVKFDAGYKLNAGVCNNGDGKVSLEIEGFDYGVGYVHGLTWEDIEFV